MSVQGQEQYCFQCIQSATPTEIFSYFMIIRVGHHIGGTTIRQSLRIGERIGKVQRYMILLILLT